MMKHRNSPMAAPMGRRMILVLMLVALGSVLAGCATAPTGVRDRRVLVLDFENTIPDSQASTLSRSLAELLTANLINYPRVAVVERTDAQGQGGRNWLEAGRAANVDYVVAGTVSKLDNHFILNARILSMHTGEAIKNSSVTRACDREEDLYPVIQAMARVLGLNLKILAERNDAWEANQAQ